MKSLLVKIICGILFCIALVGGIYKYRVLSQQKKQLLIKTNCEELCIRLSLTIEDYYKCCINCYHWENLK